MGTPRDQYTGRDARPGGEDVQPVTRRADVDDRSAKPTAGASGFQHQHHERSDGPCTAVLTSSPRHDGQNGGCLAVHTSTCTTRAAAGASSLPDTRAMLRTANIAHASCPAALPYPFALTRTEPQPGQPLARLTIVECIGKVQLRQPLILHHIKLRGTTLEDVDPA